MPASRAFLFVLIVGLLTLVFLRPGSRILERGVPLRGATVPGGSGDAPDPAAALVAGRALPEKGSDFGSNGSGMTGALVRPGRITLPDAAESEAARKRFLSATGLNARLPPGFLYRMDTDLDDRLHLLHGFDPKSRSRIVAYGLKGTASDTQIFEYVMETSGLSPAAMDEVEEKEALSFVSSSGLGTGRVFMGVDPATGREIKAVLVTTAAGDRTYLLALFAKPTYFVGYEDQIDELLSGLTVQK